MDVLNSCVEDMVVPLSSLKGAEIRHESDALGRNPKFFPKIAQEDSVDHPPLNFQHKNSL